MPTMIEWVDRLEVALASFISQTPFLTRQKVPGPVKGDKTMELHPWG